VKKTDVTGEKTMKNLYRYTMALFAIAIFTIAYSPQDALAGAGSDVSTISTGDIIITPEMLRERLRDSEDGSIRALSVGTASNPVLLGSKMTNPDTLIIDTYLPSGTNVYISADPDAGISTIEGLDMCSRDDMICQTEDMTDSAFPKAHYSCQDGVWEEIEKSGTCFRKAGCCYPSRDKFGCASITASQSGGIEFDHRKMKTSGSECKTTFVPKEKDYCVVENDDNPGLTFGRTAAGNNVQFYGGITGETGDDMFRVQSGADAILVHNQAASVFPELKAVKINYSGPKDLMIPSGPPGEYTDWKRFIENPPASIAIEKLGYEGGPRIGGAMCPPIAVSLCGIGVGSSLPEPPVVNAECGFADDNPRFGGPSDEYLGFNEKGYASLDEIDKEGLCVFGDPIIPATQDDPDYLVWTCAPPPIISGGNLDSCKTPRLPSAEQVTVVREDFGCDFAADDEEADKSCAALTASEWNQQCPASKQTYTKNCTDYLGADRQYCNEAQIQCI